MVRDTKILDYLSGLTQNPLSTKVYRVTPQTLNPIAPSVAGGRWMLPGNTAVLYTSLEREGALGELSFHLGMLTPLPSKPMQIHTIEVALNRVIAVGRKDFPFLGIDEKRFGEISYGRTQMVGDAAGFLGCDGIIVPSARWPCENLVIFSDNHAMDLALNVVTSETIEWQTWARAHVFIDTEQ